MHVKTPDDTQLRNLDALIDKLQIFNRDTLFLFPEKQNCRSVGVLEFTKGHT
jgi:hypothetical protein